MNRVAIVTGGTGALGSAIARAFAGAGYEVHVTSSAPSKAAPDVPAKVHAVDLADLQATRQFSAAFAEVHALVLAAGGFAAGALADLGPDDLERMFRVNVSTAANTLAAFANHLAQGASAVLVGSQSYEGAAGIAAYAASKAAVVSLGKSASAELRPRGVRVNVVLPDTIDTPANRSAMPTADTSRWSPPDDIARIVLWLCSPEAALLSGNALRVGR
jgi:NAD(P)-dependent dehydrogenase (short-subunit alcohol dehydrogenase family)